MLREGDRLACWRSGTAEIGLSVTRAGSLVLGLGTLGHTPGGDVTIDHDSRVEERELACDVLYIDRPGTQIVLLDPDRPTLRRVLVDRADLDGFIESRKRHNGRSVS